MTLKIKISKAEHDALEESVKGLYIAEGDGFKLDADYEDVDGLKAKRDELLMKVTEAREALKKFDGIDPEAAKNALTKLSEIEDGQLLKRQQFDEVLKKRSEEWEKKEAALNQKIAGMVARQAESQLAMKLAEAGVKPAMAEDLAQVLTNRHITFDEVDGVPVWKTKDGLETIDLDKYIPSLKESKADYFNSTLGVGSGATGSNGNGNVANMSGMTAEQKIEAGFQQRK